jgi:ATP-binding cassette subfamily B protein
MSSSEAGRSSEGGRSSGAGRSSEVETRQAPAPPGQLKQTERVQAGPGGPGRGPFGGGMVGQKAHDFKQSARRLVGRLRPERPKVLAVLGLTVVSVLLSAIGPRILGHATDLIFAGLIGGRLPEGLTKAQAVAALRARGRDNVADMVSSMDVVPGQGVDFTAVGHVLLGVLAIYVLGSLLAWLAGYLLNDVVQGTVRRMRTDVEAKVNRLPLSYFDRQPRGELLSRATNDIDNVSQSLQQTMSQLLTSVLTVFAVLAMMLWISPLLALIALLTVPLTMLVAGGVMKRSQGQFVQQWRRTGTLNAHIEETFSGHALVKVFGRQQEAERVFARENEELYRASFSAQFISGLVMPIMMFIGNLNYVLVAVVGGLRVASGHLSLGDVQAFIQYTRQFTQPLAQVASMANLLQSGVASAERVFELLDAEEESDDGRTTPAPAAERRGEVRFERVSFAYDPDRPLIRDLSLVADPGHTVAIVGPTGAGKTTLVNLIERFYELDGGRITLDGVDIASMSRAALREQIGMVLQDTWLFAGSIRDNIAYGAPDATEEEILQAARATYVDRFVHSLPDGYDTHIDEEGSNLSAGERQLVTIARAFLSDPALLILDEATSSVDTRTELLLQQAMAALRSDRTSFVIAHRLSTIRDADLILVMEAGAIVEQGTHDELLAADGAYARLYASQFAAPLESGADPAAGPGGAGGSGDRVPAGASPR